MGALTQARAVRFASSVPMQGRTVRRVVALLSTVACCIALPASVEGATDDTQAAPKAKSTTKSPAKTSTASKSKSSSKASSKSSAKSSKASSSKSSSSHSAGKSSKATTSTKKPSAAPATKPPASEAVRAAFDPASPTATGIPGAPSATAAAAPGQRGPTRIDFDDRLIQGQRNTAGAVYLYDRKELKQRSMIKKRDSFREEIVGVVYDTEL